MTREEAIDRLRKISEKTPIRTNGNDLIAITMAIQALSQEPCDKCEVGNPCLYCKHEFEPQESEETETWNGYHGQIIAPKGTFKKIYEDAESDE